MDSSERRREQRFVFDEVPELYARTRPTYPAQLIEATAQCREYGWQTEYSSAQYTDLLRTHSDHRMLDAERLSRLLTAITKAIDGHGGLRIVDYVAVLCWARRISATSAG